MSAFACSPIRGSEPGVGWNWANEMSKYHDVWVVTRKSNKEEIEKFGSNTKVKFIYISIPFLDFLEKYTNKKSIHFYYNLWQKYIYYKIKNLDEVDSFDIIHHVTYNEFRNPGNLCNLNSPFILGPIGGAQEIESELLEYCETKKNIFIEKVRSYINRKYSTSKSFNKTINNTKKVLVANQATSRFLKLDQSKTILMLETGIKKENLNYIIRENRPQIRLLWVGNLIYIKGLRLLIEAFEKIQYKEMYEIIIIGEGNLRVEYENLIKERNLSKYFEFTGKLSYSETLKQYRNADIFIFTSLRDTSGNVVLEAMSNCLPVIALNHHGCEDMLNENCAIKINIISAEQVVRDLSIAINDLGKNYDKRIEMGLNGYKRIEDLYLWSKKGIEMNKIYNEVYSERFNI